MDLATIGLKAESSSIVKGSKDLDGLTAASKRADAANNNFAGSSLKAAKATEQIGKSATLATRGFGLLKGAIAGALVTLVGIGAASFSLKKFVDATSEAEAVQAQLTAALRSTHSASGQTIASLNEQSKALQNITTFGDEAIGTAQGILLTFTKIGKDVFPQATTAVVNLATRMGGDLNGAALQIGKALNAPIQGITALSRAGIQFTASQKDLIKTAVESGNTLKAQEIILKELETQFGGSATAARETLGGALTALGESFGDLFELSGPATEALRASIERVIAAISDPAFIQFVNLIGTVLFTSLSLVVQVLSTFAGWLPKIAEFLIPLAPLMLAAFGPMIIANVTSLASAIGVTLFKSIVSLITVLSVNPFTIFLAAVVVVLSFMVDWQKAIKALIQIWALFVIAWNEFWGDQAGVDRAIKLGLDAGEVTAQLTDAADKAKQILTDGVSFGADQASPKLTNAMVAGGDAAASKIGAAVAMTGDMAKKQFDNLNGTVIKPLGDTLIDGGDYIFNQVTGSITKGSKEGATDLSKGVKDGGKEAGETIGTAMTTAASSAGGSIFSDLSSLGDVWSNSLQGFMGDLIVQQVKANLNLIDAQTAQANATAQKLSNEAREIARNKPRQVGSADGGATSGGGGGGSNNGGFGTTNDRGAAPSTLWHGGVAPSQDDDLNAWGVGIGINAGSFARGGSFRVPGSGGGDRKQVSFKASPGERVTVEPLNQRGGGDSKTELKIVNNFNPRDMLSAIGTSEGQNTFVNVIQANRDVIQEILGVH